MEIPVYRGAGGRHVTCVIQHLRAQIAVIAIEDGYVPVMHRVGGMISIRAIILSGIIIRDKEDITEKIYPVSQRIGRGMLLTAQMRWTQVHRKVDLTRPGGGIGGKGDIFLIEGIVTVVTQQFGNPHTLLVEFVSVKDIAG